MHRHPSHTGRLPSRCIALQTLSLVFQQDPQVTDQRHQKSVLTTRSRADAHKRAPLNANVRQHAVANLQPIRFWFLALVFLPPCCSFHSCACGGLTFCSKIECSRLGLFGGMARIRSSGFSSFFGRLAWGTCLPACCAARTWFYGRSVSDYCLNCCTSLFPAMASDKSRTGLSTFGHTGSISCRVPAQRAVHLWLQSSGHGTSRVCKMPPNRRIEAAPIL